MFISMNWIKDFVDLSGLNEVDLIQRFTLSTAEVEDIIIKGKDTSNVVAAQIKSVEKHPDSKKLHLLKIDAGDGIYDCVCGAPNVREGMIVPFAKAGGSVCGNAIKEATVAGYQSCGMCCSAAELGISADNSGLMEITDNVPLGTDIKKLYQIEDIVFEVDNKSLTNRPDLWGHYGIAREFSAITERELKPIEKLDCSVYSNLEKVPISIKDTENAYRYCGLRVENISKTVSPVNMQIRLFYCGSRAINLLADLTNYIMLELGQPMHAFDSRRVSSIEVKRFDKPIKFTTLDNTERTIDENTLMICSDNQPVAIAGIMGGLNSEIEDDTNSLLLESANFNAVSVRKSSSRLGLRTDASMRYEKTLDPELTYTAIERFMKLLTDIDSGVKVVSSLTDVYVKHYDKISFGFDKKYVDRYTGINISNEQIVKTLKLLGFGIKNENDEFFVEVPSWRATKDVTIKADIIEEITRIYGYDNFDIKTTRSRLRPVKAETIKSDENRIKDILVNKFNLNEVHSYIWCESKKLRPLEIEVEDNVKLLNSLASENSTIRNSMIPTLISFVNDNKTYSSDFGLFEIGKVVEGLKEDKTCNERKKLGFILFSKTKTEKELYFEVRNIIEHLFTSIKHRKPVFTDYTLRHKWEHPVNSAAVMCGDFNAGYMSVLHPANQRIIDKKAAIVFAQIDVNTFANIDCVDIEYKEPSKYPESEIDLCLVTDKNIKYADIESTCLGVNCPFLKNICVIDIFEGKNMTIRLTFGSNERTLNSDEIKEYTDKIIASLAEKGILLKQ